MLSFLNNNSGAIQGISTIVLVLVTIYYAVQTRLMVKEAKEARKYEFIPILDVNTVIESGDILRITLNNIGKGLARSPEIHIPGQDIPVFVKDIRPRGIHEERIPLKPSELVARSAQKRKIEVRYLDVFGRKVASVAKYVVVIKNEIAILDWRLVLPT